MRNRADSPCTYNSKPSIVWYDFIKGTLEFVYLLLDYLEQPLNNDEWLASIDVLDLYV